MEASEQSQPSRGMKNKDRLRRMTALFGAVMMMWRMKPLFSGPFDLSCGDIAAVNRKMSRNREQQFGHLFQGALGAALRDQVG
jgi:hypothetical protein